MKQPKKQPVSEKKRAASAKNISDYREKLGRSPHEKHGITLAINTGGQKLPSVPYAAEVRERAQSLIDAAVVDLGGEDQITGTQRQVLEAQRVSLIVLGLASHYLASEGVVNRKTGKTQALLGTLAAFVNSTRLNALALGLTRIPKDANLIDMKRYEKAAPIQPEKEIDADAQ